MHGLLCGSQIKTKYAWDSPYSKASDLEEELKNVTNNLKSLEAQSEKVQDGQKCIDTLRSNNSALAFWRLVIFFQTRIFQI